MQQAEGGPSENSPARFETEGAENRRVSSSRGTNRRRWLLGTTLLHPTNQTRNRPLTLSGKKDDFLESDPRLLAGAAAADEMLRLGKTHPRVSS